MRHNILPIRERYNENALLCGLAKHTPVEAEIEVCNLLIVGELVGEEAVMVVLVYRHRTTGYLVTKPEVFSKAVLAQLEADGTDTYPVAAAA